MHMKLQIILVQEKVNLKLGIIIKSYLHRIDDTARDLSNTFGTSATKINISSSIGELQKQLALYTCGTR